MESTTQPQPLEEIREDAPGPEISPALSYATPAITRSRPRGYSSVSRVEVDFFDPQGVNDLRRTLTRMATTETVPTIGQTKTPEGAVSSTTLAVGDGVFDFEKTLRTVVKRLDEADVKSRELGVYFENLRVVGLGATVSYTPTLASMLNPLNIIEAVKTFRHPPLRDIISGFEGVVRPGEMLLVLGSPGSGCSTLLKTLTNQRGEYHSVHGNVHYDSLTPRQIAHHYRGDIQYCPEDDIHFPTLSVEQTVSFAATTRAPNVNTRLVGQDRRSYVGFVTDVCVTLFGLRHARKTPVGDAAVRGVSGGEKKRVSISEAMAARSVINAWDNSTRGLDASTALEFVRALRIANNITHMTTMVSIYQAGESLYELFDKVCVIYEGKMAYFGHADQARQYFVDMGYEPVNRQTTADFLVAVTDPNGRTLRPDVDAQSVPRTASDFEAYFRESDAGRVNRGDMDAYRGEFMGRPERAVAYRESALAEHARHVRRESPYMVSVPMQVRAVMVRRVQIMMGDFTAQGIQAATYVVQAVILGTTFLKIKDDTSAFFSRGGIMFFALFLPTLFTTAEIPMLFSQRPIIYRHQKAAMYHPFIDALASILVDIPITFVVMALYTIVLYFIIQLQQSAQQFFTFFLIVFTVAIIMKSFFRALAAAFPSEAPAQSVAGVCLLILALYTGYTLPLPSMIGALRWISYINPLRYAFEAVMVNEFHTINGACAQIVPSGPGYESVAVANQVCTTVGSVPGEAKVSGSRFLTLSFGYVYSHLWRNFGILVAFGVFFVGCLLVFTENNVGVAGETAVVLFKRGSKAADVVETTSAKEDEEKNGGQSTRSGSAVDGEEVKEKGEVEVEVVEQPKMTDIFSWRHVNFVVPVGHHESRRLLDDVSGYVVPGKLTALMGESGAGKTTLLNVLAERAGTGVVTGDRFVNGQALPKDFQAQTGYCQQMDVHVPTTTVFEALLFSASMRQPQSVSSAEKEAYARHCLKMCGLEAYADAMVGSLDIEHRKRTTIGVELAAKPQLLLFLDEPTSGLDSESARAIMGFLRSLADNGQAILCTIHQPSAELFQVFDRLLLLRKGGQTVYFGDIGTHATTLIHYLESNGSRPCKPDENPAEFMLDVLGAGATATSDQDWHEIWKESKEYLSSQDVIEKIHTEGRNRPPIAAAVHGDFATSWGHQATELIRRNFISYWRNPTYLLAKLALNIVGGLFIGFTFFKSKDTIQGTQNKLFAIFMSTILSAPLSGQLHVPFISLRDIYEIRERPSRMYHWSALITSQLIVELPWNVMGSILFFVCWYWTVGFENSRAGYTFLLYAIMFPIYYTTIAQAIASMAPNAEIAGLLFSFLFSFVLTFNGVLQPFRLLGWWQWMYHLSPFTYLIEGLVGQAIGRQEINCATKELAQLQPPSGSTCGAYMQSYITSHGGYLVNSNATSDCLYCSARTTDEFFGPTFNIEYSHHWRNAGFFAVYIAFNVVALFAITYLFRVRSPASLIAGLRRRWATRKAPKTSTTTA